MPTHSRREARERALSLLYEMDIRDSDADAVLDELPVKPDPYTSDVVHGVSIERKSIDEVIALHAERWAVDRMPVIDRSLLRMATFELVYRAEIPTAVVISEAVELAKEYSTEDSGRFVNGMLSRIAQKVRDDAIPAVLDPAIDGVLDSIAERQAGDD